MEQCGGKGRENLVVVLHLTTSHPTKIAVPLLLGHVYVYMDSVPVNFRCLTLSGFLVATTIKTDDNDHVFQQ